MKAFGITSIACFKASNSKPFKGGRCHPHRRHLYVKLVKPESEDSRPRVFYNKKAMKQVELGCSIIS